MFEAKLENGDQIMDLKRLLRVFNEYVSEVKAEITEQGIEIEGVDSAMVCILNLDISSEMFDSYLVASRQKIGLDITKLKGGIEKCRKKDELGLKVLEKEVGGKKVNSIEATIYDKGTSTEMLYPLLAINDDDFPSKDDLEFDALVDISRKKFNRVLQAISGAFELEVDENGVTATYQTKDQRVKAKLPKESDYIKRLKCEEKIRTMYSRDYLDGIQKLTLPDTLTVKFGDDFPMKIEAEGEHWEFSFILAPRIDEDEN